MTGMDGDPAGAATPEAIGAEGLAGAGGGQSAKLQLHPVGRAQRQSCRGSGFVAWHRLDAVAAHQLCQDQNALLRRERRARAGARAGAEGQEGALQGGPTSLGAEALRGSNSSGRSHSALCLCTSQGDTATISPADTALPRNWVLAAAWRR